MVFVVLVSYFDRRIGSAPYADRSLCLEADTAYVVVNIDDEFALFYSVMILKENHKIKVVNWC